MKAYWIGEDYEIIYKLSIELDELIASYYREEYRPLRSGILKGNKLIIAN